MNVLLLDLLSITNWFWLLDMKMAALLHILTTPDI